MAQLYKHPKNGTKFTNLYSVDGEVPCAFVGLVTWFDVGLEKLDDVFGRGAGKKYFGNSLLFQFWQIFLRHDTADQDQAVIHALLTKQLDDARAESVVCAT